MLSDNGERGERGEGGSCEEDVGEEGERWRTNSEIECFRAS